MRIELTHQADRDYDRLSSQLRKQVDKQLNLLRDNIRHPSLDSKKYGGTDDMWQGRVNRNYRFYFFITDDIYRILRIIPHPK